MPSPDDGMIKGFLMALESTMDTCDRVSTVAGQLLASQRDNKPLAPSVLNYYRTARAVRSAAGAYAGHDREVVDAHRGSALMATGRETRAQIDTETVKGLLYMSGGGAVALLAFLPSVLTNPQLRALSFAVLWGMFIYQLGLVFAVVHNRLRRKCSLEYESAPVRPCQSRWLKWLSRTEEPCICKVTRGSCYTTCGGRRSGTWREPACLGQWPCN